jgi:hypothetical protein
MIGEPDECWRLRALRCTTRPEPRELSDRSGAARSARRQPALRLVLASSPLLLPPIRRSTDSRHRLRYRAVEPRARYAESRVDTAGYRLLQPVARCCPRTSEGGRLAERGYPRARPCNSVSRFVGAVRLRRVPSRDRAGGRTGPGIREPGCAARCARVAHAHIRVADGGIRRVSSAEEAIATVESLGSRFLYAPTRQPWQADRVFHKPSISGELKSRIEGASERTRALLVDALDPSLHEDEYRVYACLADFEPGLPAWPDEYGHHPVVIDRLIPHLTGLARPTNLAAAPATHRGSSSQSEVTCVIGDVEWRADAILRSINDKRTCGEIDQVLQNLTGVTEPVEVRVGRWLDLANRGFLLLKSPDPRQNIDCQHLGPIQDRLDCPCPRRWIRACERHGFCSIDQISEDEVQEVARDAALNRLGLKGGCFLRAVPRLCCRRMIIKLGRSILPILDFRLGSRLEAVL